MKSSPTKSWWDKFKEAASSLPDGPVNTVKPGQPIMVGYKAPGEPFRVVPSKELPDPTLYQLHQLHRLPDGAILDVDRMLKENTELLEKLQMQRQLTANAQRNESLMARRVEAFRKKWPDIHKQFFASEKGKAT